MTFRGFTFINYLTIVVFLRRVNQQVQNYKTGISDKKRPKKVLFCSYVTKQ